MLIVGNHSFLLFAPLCIRCSHGTLYGTNRPAETVGILADPIIGIHRQHEFSLDTGEHLEQAAHVFPVEHPRIMPHIGTDIGRIHEMKGRRGIEAEEYFQGVVLLDGAFFEQLLEFGKKTVFGCEDSGTAFSRSTGIRKGRRKYA